MADQEYKVKLDDEISPGLQRILTLLEKIEGKTNSAKKPKAFQAATKSVEKTSKSTEKGAKSFEKFDKVLNTFSTPIGQVAGKFGFMGDLVESSTGKMIGMGGAMAGAGVAILGVGATVGIFAAGLYGMGKAAFYFDSVTKGMNKTLLTTIGNLGKYHSKTKEVIDASLSMNARLGKSYEDVATTISTAVKAGATVEQGKQLAYVNTVMNQFGEVGSKFNKTLNEVYEGKGKLQSSDDIARLLIQTGAINKQMTQAQKNKQIQLFKTSNTQKQLEMITKNREQMEKLKKVAESTVPAADKIKQAFVTMFTKALGGGGSLDKSIENLIQWTENPENIAKINDLFTNLSATFQKVMSNSGPLFDRIMDIVGGIEKLLQMLGLLENKQKEREQKAAIEKNIQIEENRLESLPGKARHFKELEQPKIQKNIQELQQSSGIPEFFKNIPEENTNNKSLQLSSNSIIPDYSKQLTDTTLAINRIADQKPQQNITQHYSITITEANDPVKTIATMKKFYEDQAISLG